MKIELEDVHDDEMYGFLTRFAEIIYYEAKDGKGPVEAMNEALSEFNVEWSLFLSDSGEPFPRKVY